MENKLIVKGARTHNLKNITVEMPRDKLIVFTGLSGSGKSSLAFDTIFAEGQRRYVESLSAYARQFLRQMQKPDVDEIVGLSPAISIDQKSRSNNPRSTVATITEIYDYLRVLFARIGRPHCLICGSPIEKLSKDEIMQFVLERIGEVRDHTHATNAPKQKTRRPKGGAPQQRTFEILAPLVRGRKGEYYQMLYDLLGKGYASVVVDGERHLLREQILLDKNKRHDIDVLVDTLSAADFASNEPAALERLAEALERALTESDGLVRVHVLSPDGAPNLGSAIERARVPIIEPQETFLLSSKFACPRDGYSFPEVEPRLFSFNSPYGACPDCNGLGTRHFFGNEVCPACHGARLRPEALQVFLGINVQHRVLNKNIQHSVLHPTNMSIVDVVSLSIADVIKFFDTLKLTPKEQDIARVVLREITSRLQFMANVGIDYLTLDRRANTLSGGEAQRIRLASQLGSGLVGALYVLDEPTIGLHQRDNDRLIETLKKLRDLGNTIIVVEHDEDTIFAADYIVDIGPGAGVHGGEVVVAGELEKLLTTKRNTSGSRTLGYLRGEEAIPIPEKRRTAEKGTLQIRGAKKHNIDNINFDIPLGRIVAITGVSGSGKSTLLYDILYENLRARFDRRYRSAKVYNCSSFSGTEYVGRAIMIDQSPIGRTPRSNPATYTGAFTFIRELFAESPDARVRGWRPGRFSFNVRGGRCEACQGNGEIAVEMHFLPTVYVTCDVCNGKRFMKETLEVRYRKKNIDEVLHMTIEEASAFFEEIPAIADRLKTLADTGLGYLELGQSATTLSGGEAQRIKIAAELYRPFLSKTIYLLDEPTVGLHYDDVRKLIEIFERLVGQGNTVVVIEHNMDILKCADYLIDLGPEGGEGGGRIVAKGTPEEVARSGKGHTATYLARVIKK
ncbi:MAG: excinuclease ABC subunit UvrA [bacterium]|nr:excinuclease ABC subunit UvrA [bacterium]MDZ4285013.1 excinuclease ABC subunit UvrA [Patescibacteria group bacterium]